MREENDCSALATSEAKSLVEMLRLSNRRAGVAGEKALSEEQYRALEEELARKLFRRAA